MSVSQKLTLVCAALTQLLLDDYKGLRHVVTGWS